MAATSANNEVIYLDNMVEFVIYVNIMAVSLFIFIAFVTV